MLNHKTKKQGILYPLRKNYEISNAPNVRRRTYVRTYVPEASNEKNKILFCISSCGHGGFVLEPSCFTCFSVVVVWLPCACALGRLYVFHFTTCSMVLGTCLELAFVWNFIQEPNARKVSACYRPLQQAILFGHAMGYFRPSTTARCSWLSAIHC